MSWCDKLASVPAVGISMDLQFTPSSHVLDALNANFLADMVEKQKPTFNVTTPDAFAVSITAQNGFIYAVEPAKASVTFQHSLKAKAVSGGPPVMEMLSTPLPYTELLNKGCNAVLRLALATPGSRKRDVNRLGIVSSTTVSQDDAPPGIMMLVEYFSRPWSGKVPFYHFQIVAELGGTSAYTDRCIHTINKSEENDDLVVISLDWQRNLAPKRPLHKEIIEELLVNAQRDALNYFEELGEGSRFDEELISIHA